MPGLVLTHGAGGNRNSPLLVAVAGAFTEAGWTVERVDLSFRQARPSGPPRPGDAAFRPLYVQGGAFAEQKNAQSLVSRLKQGGFSNSFVVSTGQGSTRIHRVRIGPLGNADEFDRIRYDLRAVGVFESRLVVDN